MNTDQKQMPPGGAKPDFTDRTKANPPGEQMFRGSEIDTPKASPAPPDSSLKKDGVALKEKAIERLTTEADSRKEDVSKQLKSVSGALHAAEDALSKKDGDAAEWLKSGLHQVVTTVEDLAERVANKDSAELINEVKSFARENPKTFLAACAAAGFAAARVFKAGGSEDKPQAESPTASGGRP